MVDLMSELFLRVRQSNWKIDTEEEEVALQLLVLLSRESSQSCPPGTKALFAYWLGMDGVWRNAKNARDPTLSCSAPLPTTTWLLSDLGCSNGRFENGCVSPKQCETLPFPLGQSRDWHGSVTVLGRNRAKLWLGTATAAVNRQRTEIPSWLHVAPWVGVHVAMGASWNRLFSSLCVRALLHLAQVNPHPQTCPSYTYTAPKPWRTA